ncbi:hypothetical protein ABZW02_36965, partial [Streptomyces sp. NPDC005180]
YRFDPATGSVTLIGTVGPAGGFVWCLTTAPDGTVYAGTYPRGEVWEYSPATGVLRNLGVARPGEQYVRAIAADDRFVYAGTLPLGHIVAYDRATGAKQSITPEPYGGAACLLARGGRVIGGFGRSVIDLAPDGSDARVIPIPATERLVDAITTTADGTVYCIGRPTGTVYRRALFGLGEAMLSPTVAPLVADLAPESMVGQYNSAFALVKQLALAVGPAVGGPMGAALHGPYIVTFVLFSLGITVLALKLGRNLTAVQDQPALASKSRIVARHRPEQDKVEATA